MKRALLGSMIGVVAGGAWGVVGAMGLPRPWSAWAMGSGITISVVLIIALAMSRVADASATFRRAVYLGAVAFEALAISIAVWVLRRFALSEFLVPAIGIIVGLHFIGLWRATYQSKFIWIAFGMCAVCVFSMFLPGRAEFGIGARQAVAGLGCAAVLWSAGVYTLFGTSRAHPQD